MTYINTNTINLYHSHEQVGFKDDEISAVQALVSLKSPCTSTTDQSSSIATQIQETPSTAPRNSIRFRAVSGTLRAYKISSIGQSTLSLSSPQLTLSNKQNSAPQTKRKSSTSNTKKHKPESTPATTLNLTDESSRISLLSRALLSKQYNIHTLDFSPIKFPTLQERVEVAIRQFSTPFMICSETKSLSNSFYSLQKQPNWIFGTFADITLYKTLETRAFLEHVKPNSESHALASEQDMLISIVSDLKLNNTQPTKHLSRIASLALSNAVDSSITYDHNSFTRHASLVISFLEKTPSEFHAFQFLFPLEVHSSTSSGNIQAIVARLYASKFKNYQEYLSQYTEQNLANMPLNEIQAIETNIKLLPYLNSKIESILHTAEHDTSKNTKYTKFASLLLRFLLKPYSQSSSNGINELVEAEMHYQALASLPAKDFEAFKKIIRTTWRTELASSTLHIPHTMLIDFNEILMMAKHRVLYAIEDANVTQNALLKTVVDRTYNTFQLLSFVLSKMEFSIEHSKESIANKYQQLLISYFLNYSQENAQACVNVFVSYLGFLTLFPNIERKKYMTLALSLYQLSNIVVDSSVIDTINSTHYLPLEMKFTLLKAMNRFTELAKA